MIPLIDLPQTPTKCGLGSQRRDTNISGSKRAIQIYGEPEHISVGAQFSENRSTPKLENRSTSQLEHGPPRTGAHLSWSMVLREPEHISVGARFSENRSTVLREPEHGFPRTRARFSENQSTVLPEPEHGSPRTKARFSENQSTVLRESRFSDNRSTPKLENRSTSQLEHGSPRTGAHLSWRTREHLRTSPSFLRSPCSPRAPNLLHVLPARLVGWNDLWWRST